MRTKRDPPESTRSTTSRPSGHRLSNPRNDLALVITLALLTFVLAVAFELHERVASVALRFEAWQVDEIPLTLTALSFGLAWYAWRRWREVSSLLARNRELARRLIAVQESERCAIARELHDEMAQHCTSIRIEAAYVQRTKDSAQIVASAQRSAATAEMLHEGVHRLLRRLRPAELDELGLVAALGALCDGCETRSRLRCVFEHRGRLQALGEKVDIAIYRIAQEALSNTVRHARAGTVRIVLAADRHGLVLDIADDGCGFDARRTGGRLGLLGVAERAAALGADLQVTSRPGEGTRLRLTLILDMTLDPARKAPLAPERTFA